MTKNATDMYIMFFPALFIDLHSPLMAIICITIHLKAFNVAKPLNIVSESNFPTYFITLAIIKNETAMYNIVFPAPLTLSDITDRGINVSAISHKAPIITIA